MARHHVGFLGLLCAVTVLLLDGSGRISAVQADQQRSPATPGSVEWRFNEPQSEWKSALAIAGLEAAQLEYTPDALRLTLPEGGRLNAGLPIVGGVYVDLLERRREEWAEVVVQIRSGGSVNHVRLGLNSPDSTLTSPPGLQRSQRSLFGATFQILGGGPPPGGETPLVRDGRVHTYRIHPDWGNEPIGPLRRVGLWFTAFAPGSVDVLSVRMVPVAAGPPPHRVLETTLQPGQLQTDFTLARRALEEAHAALYYYTTKQDMDATFAAVEAQLTRPMTVLEFHNVLAPALAAIRDGQTLLTTYQGDEIRTVLDSAKQFPLALTFEENRAFVLLNQGLDRRVKPGMEVLAINGMSLAQLLQRILPNLSRYGDIEGWTRYQLGMWAADPRSRNFFQVGRNGSTGFGEAYRLFIGDPPSFRTTLRDPKTEQSLVVDLAGVAVAEAAVKVEQNPVNRDVLAGLRALRVGYPGTGQQAIRYLDGEDTAILVNFPASPEPFANFIEKTIAELRNRETKNLILDLRGYTGGPAADIPAMFSHLTSREFRFQGRRYIKTIQPSFEQYTSVEIDPTTTRDLFGPESEFWRPDTSGGWQATDKADGMGVYQPSDNRFEGSLYVLIDGGSFSAGGAFPAIADFHKRATFIGEETGSAAEGSTSSGGLDVTLPESHLHLQIPNAAYFFSVDIRKRRRGTVPTYEVRQTIDDLAKGRDTVVEFTRELIRSGK